MNRLTLLLGIFLTSSLLNASSVSDSLEKVQERFQSHDSGHVFYERDVYVLRDQPYSVYTDSKKLNALLTNRAKVISDKVDFYYVRSDNGKKRHFMELQNTLPVPPLEKGQGLVAQAEYATKNYRKLFIVDEGRNKMFWGVYDHGNNHKFINSMIAPYQAGFQPDQGLDRTVPLIDEILFTPYSFLEIDSDPKQLSSVKQDGITSYWFESNNTPLRLDMHDTFGYPTHAGFGDPILGGKQVYFLDLIDYRKIGDKHIPNNVLFKMVYIPTSIASQASDLVRKNGLDSVKLNAVVARFRILKAEFDDPSIEAKVSFDRIEGKDIPDSRLDRLDSTVKPYSDSEKVYAENSIRGYLKRPFVIGATVLAALAVWFFRRRTSRT